MTLNSVSVTIYIMSAFVHVIYLPVVMSLIMMDDTEKLNCATRFITATADDLCFSIHASKQ